MNIKIKSIASVIVYLIDTVTGIMTSLFHEAILAFFLLNTSKLTLMLAVWWPYLYKDKNEQEQADYTYVLRERTLREAQPVPTETSRSSPRTWVVHGKVEPLKI